MLGAGTRLALAKRSARALVSDSVEGDDARISALVCAAYGRPLDPRALRYIHRALVKHSEGDATLALMHLAMTGLWPLKEPRQAAYRLFMADRLMKAGLVPRDLIRALGQDPGSVDQLERRGYDPNQPCVPAGNGRPSGRWGDGFGEGGALPEFGEDRKPIMLATSSSDISPFLYQSTKQTAMILIALFAAQQVASRILDLIFVPRRSPSAILEGEVPDYPNIRYRWDGSA
ncbi:hypothetical protein [Methylocapsa sp. S129]|uniref:hypothetical protein n=1 Tax=Methylocapsa sp. S129 TaxID=1641869 RepID=UPI00131E1954|nr:hypothetical protein [Methylocapsa sp. S129]